ATPSAPPMRLSADALNRFGEALGRELAAPAVVGLSGELGTGKTTFVQAICRGLGARGLATSPTYALVHQYRTPEGRVVYHVDCYRLRSPAEAQDLGLDRKSTRLNSSHVAISYAVFCLTKKINFPARIHVLTSYRHTHIFHPA